MKYKEPGTKEEVKSHFVMGAEFQFGVRGFELCVVVVTAITGDVFNVAELAVQ